MDLRNQRLESSIFDNGCEGHILFSYSPAKAFAGELFFCRGPTNSMSAIHVFEAAVRLLSADKNATTIIEQRIASSDGVSIAPVDDSVSTFPLIELVDFFRAKNGDEAKTFVEASFLISAMKQRINPMCVNKLFVMMGFNYIQ